MKKIVIICLVILAVIGGILITANNVESKREIESTEETAVSENPAGNEEAEDQFYEELISESGIYQGKTFWNPDSGSKEYELMEGLVKRGRLKRSEMGGYQLK